MELFRKGWSPLSKCSLSVLLRFRFFCSRCSAHCRCFTLLWSLTLHSNIQKSSAQTLAGNFKRKKRRSVNVMVWFWLILSISYRHSLLHTASCLLAHLEQVVHRHFTAQSCAKPSLQRTFSTNHFLACFIFSFFLYLARLIHLCCSICESSSRISWFSALWNFKPSFASAYAPLNMDYYVLYRLHTFAEHCMYTVSCARGNCCVCNDAGCFFFSSRLRGCYCCPIHASSWFSQHYDHSGLQQYYSTWTGLFSPLIEISNFCNFVWE